MILKIWVHFVADFVLQSDWMAVNKSKNSWLGSKAMGTHILIYTLTLIPFFGIKFAILNGVFHCITDIVTSRVTSWAWQLGKRHLFFVIIGLDQAIHLTCLALT